MQNWHSLSIKDVVSQQESDLELGLRNDVAQQRLHTHGPNELPQAPRKSWLAVWGHQFASPLIYLLLAAAGIAASLKHWNDAAVIVVVVVLNAVIGALQEGRAEKSLDALRKLTSHTAHVVREGQKVSVPAQNVVPGDLLVLEAGDAVAADARLLEAHSLQSAEAALTGESLPVAKSVKVLSEDTSLADRHNMIYAGTYVSHGRARALVVETGAASEIGRIARLAKEAQEPKTPLELRIEQLGRMLLYASAVLFVLVVGIGWLRGMALPEVVMLAISQVVAMVPEGLPVAVTVALAVGVQRMASRRAVVRKLAAIETLGATTVICSDKTGTLTRNEMTVTSVVLASGREIEINGIGYKPEGAFFENGKFMRADEHEELVSLLQAGVLCNDAQLRKEEGTWTPLGDPTEIALVVAAIKAGLNPEVLRARFPRRAEIPFDASIQMMATQHVHDGHSVVLLKGAPEAIFELCAEPPQLSVRQAAEKMASKALRVLGVAVCVGEIDKVKGREALKGKAKLLGLLGQRDPPRAEVREAVALCKAAGIRPVMVTGDHKATGQAIARDLGIFKEGDVALDGRELDAMSDEQLSSIIDRVSVFARVYPAQKLRIVEAQQLRHQVVAMTGDGVNDAPALVQANVGVAMGLSGTEVAKEASRVVIADDNFATIVAAVEEGRAVYRNIKKLILYLFSTNLSEVLVLLASLVLGYPAPLAAVQILWINLVTDGTLTLTFIMEPKEGDEMQRPPVPLSERLLTRTLLSRMAVMVPVMTASTLGWYFYRQSLGIPFAQVRTETFTVMAFSQFFNALNCRSETHSALSLTVLRNPWLLVGLVGSALLQAAVIYIPPVASVFRTTALPGNDFLSLILVSSAVLWAEELRKALKRGFSNGKHQTPVAAVST